MVLFAMLMMHASLLMLLFNRDFPAFDDMGFLSSYVGKLSTEGRWINYLIFHLVKRLNFDVVLIVNAIALFVFCFKVARNICSSQMSYAIAVFACFALPFYNVADSSLTLMSMYLIGVLAVLLCDKMQKIYFFVIFGILYCGVVSPFYFLLPLLFIHQDNKELLKVLVYWILGYIVGFAVAELMTYIRCGHFIQLGEWRNPTYITDWQGFLLNMRKSLSYITAHLQAMGFLGISALAIALMMHVWNYRKNANRGIVLFLVFISVILSAYAQAFPAGIIVSLRTSWGLFLGGLFASVLVLRRWPRIQLCVMFVLAVSNFLYSSREQEDLNRAKRVAKYSMEALGIGVNQASEVFLLSSDEGFRAWRKNVPMINPSIWSEAPMSMGFSPVRWGNDVKYLRDKNIDVEKIQFKQKGGYLYAIVNNILILKIDSSVYGDSV